MSENGRFDFLLLDSAFTWVSEKEQFVDLWNNRGDGPGGPGDAVNTMKKRNGQVVWLDIRKLR